MKYCILYNHKNIFLSGTSVFHEQVYSRNMLIQSWECTARPRQISCRIFYCSPGSNRSARSTLSSCYRPSCYTQLALTINKGMCKFFQIIFSNFVIPSQQSWRGYSNQPFVGGWVSEWVGLWMGSWLIGSFTFYLVDTIATTVFAQSLSNFTWTFTMMREGTLLILGHGAKGQGQLCTLCIRPCWHDTDYSFCPITFKLHI